MGGSNIRPATPLNKTAVYYSVCRFIYFKIV
nr:MAG TPA: hypothetical protein [Caudoviricetes sp.]